MATRLQGGFKSLGNDASFTDDDYIVTIDQDGYAGAVSDFDLFDLVFSFGGDTDQLLIAPITGSSCKMSLKMTSAVNSFVLALVAGTEEDFKVKIQKNGALYWMGYILPDGVTRENKPYGAAPVFEVRATDGIGRLKTLDYDVSTSQTTIKAHLQNILTGIGLMDFAYANTTDIVLSYLFFWQEENNAYNIETEDTISSYRADGRIWKYVDKKGAIKYASYYDVLLDICVGLNARFMFSAGKYRFVQVPEYRFRTSGTTTIYIHEWTKAGTHSTASTTNLGVWNSVVSTDTDFHAGTSDLVLFSGSLWQYAPPLKTARVNYNHFLTQNLAPDWAWDEAYTSVETYQTIDSVSNTARLKITGALTYRIDYSTGFDYSHVKFRLRIKVGSYYLKRTATFGAAGFAYGLLQWTTTSSYYEFYGASTVTTDNAQYTNLLNIETPPLSASGDLDMSFEMVEVVKWTGLVVSTGDYTEYYNFGDLYIEVLQNGVLQDQYNQNNYIVGTNTGNSKTIEIDSAIGSGPSANAIGHLQSWDGLAWVTGENWRYGTSGTYVPHGQLLATEIYGLQKAVVPRFQAQMRGVFEAHYRLQHESTATDYYIFNNGSFSVTKDEWAGEFILVSRDVSGLSATITESYVTRNNLGPNGEIPFINPSGNFPVFPGNETEGFSVPSVAVTQTSTIINEGATVTTIAIPSASGGLLYSGDVVTLVSPSGDVQQFTLTADVDAGDTTITVTSTTAATTFPAGSWVTPDPVDFYENAVVNAGGNCFEEIFLPDAGDVSVKITVNSGTWPANMDCVFVFRNGAYQVFGMSNDYYISGADAVFNEPFEADDRVVIKFHV